MTGYGVQAVGVFNGNELDCTGSTGTLKAFGSVTFPNKVSVVFGISMLILSKVALHLYVPQK